MGCSYEPSSLETADDGTNETTLVEQSVCYCRVIRMLFTWTPSGLIAMKLYVNQCHRPIDPAKALLTSVR